MSNYFTDFDMQCTDISIPREREYSRILTAAVVNSNFCKLLLTDPEKAIRDGFAGEDFHLENEDTQRLSLIHAGSLAEFAVQMNSIMV